MGENYHPFNCPSEPEEYRLGIAVEAPCQRRPAARQREIPQIQHRPTSFLQSNWRT
jgi:hypothetical protein